jgi:hypothetical protein
MKRIAHHMLDTIMPQVGPTELHLAVRQRNSGSSYYNREDTITDHSETKLTRALEELKLRLDPRDGSDRNFKLSITSSLRTSADLLYGPAYHEITAVVRKGRNVYARGAVTHKRGTLPPLHLPGWYRVYAANTKPAGTLGIDTDEDAGENTRHDRGDTRRAI